MSTLEKILTILFAALALISLVMDIGLIISVSKAKEKVVVGNWINILANLLLALAFIVVRPSVNSAALAAFLLLSLPVSGLTFLSPEGIRVPVFINGGLSPVANHSYEYGKGFLGMETLYIYNNATKKPSAQNLGIKKMKTVKMLADWYGKHGYENPLTK